MLLMPVLTSCSSSVDDDLKVTLDATGKFASTNNVSYKEAIKNALATSENWTTFKTNLANEIVYQ